jgi:hypothetical protein
MCWALKVRWIGGLVMDREALRACCTISQGDLVHAQLGNWIGVDYCRFSREGICSTNYPLPTPLHSLCSATIP